MNANDCSLLIRVFGPARVRMRPTFRGDANTRYAPPSLRNRRATRRRRHGRGPPGHRHYPNIGAFCRAGGNPRSAELDGLREPQRGRITDLPEDPLNVLSSDWWNKYFRGPRFECDGHAVHNARRHNHPAGRRGRRDIQPNQSNATLILSAPTNWTFKLIDALRTPIMPAAILRRV
jgi:hypothetical protein